MTLRLPSLHQFLFVAIVFAYLIYSGESDRKQRTEVIRQFRKNWSTLVVGRIAKTEVLHKTSGILYLYLDTIINDRWGLDQYNGGPFYLLTNGPRAKLVESGMAELRPGDLLIINTEGNLSVLRNGNSLVSHAIIYNERDTSLWDKVDLERARVDWRW